MKASRRVSLLLATALLMTTCSPRTVSPSRPARTGPSSIRMDVVKQWGRWFDLRDPHRSAGTDGELVASSYLLGRLEQAGYLVRLDPVPVGNLLHSTNVIAEPPSGTPSIVVVVSYDTGSSAPSDGLALGMFLELARALRARVPDHSVEFAALGAEHTTVNGGQVGARSLIELLKPLQHKPRIIRVGPISGAADAVSVRGPSSRAIAGRARGVAVPVRASPVLQDDVFVQAGYSETVLSGNVALGRVLLTYLARAS